MYGIGRRIRGALGLGLAWGVAWALIGGLAARALGVVTDLPLALLFAPLGVATGIVFSAILAVVASRPSFRHLSLRRFSGWGAVGGLLLTGIIVAAAALRGGAVGSEFLLFGPALTLAGAACAAGSLALAKRPDRRRLSGSAEDPPGSDYRLPDHTGE